MRKFPVVSALNRRLRQNYQASEIRGRLLQMIGNPSQVDRLERLLDSLSE